MSNKRRLKRDKEKPALNIEDFKYSDQLGLTLPQLVLGIEVTGRMDRTYKFKPGRAWIKLAHQTAGYACHQRYMLATILKPKSVEVLQNMQRLARMWDGSQAGCFGNSLDSVIKYRNDLKALFGADCNTCFQDLEEGFYAIDLDDMPKLIDDDLPDELDDLVDWESGWGRAIGCVGRWSLCLISENSD